MRQPRIPWNSNDDKPLTLGQANGQYIPKPAGATDKQILTFDYATGKWLAKDPAAASPLTTKGDLYGFDTAGARVPVGTDGQALLADSTQALGVKWGAAGGAALHVDLSVANYAALPATPAAGTTTYATLDTQMAYVWAGSAWPAEAAGISLISGRSPTVARWWRVLINVRNTEGDPTYTSVLEMEFRSTPAGGNLCVGGTAAASSQYDSTFGAANAFDGDTTQATSPGDVWACAANAAMPQWIGYELPLAAAVNEVKIWSRIVAPGGPPRDFIIQSSVDSTNGTNGMWLNEWGVNYSVNWALGEVRTFVRL